MQHVIICKYVLLDILRKKSWGKKQPMLYNLYKVMMIFDRPYSKDSGYVNGLEMRCDEMYHGCTAHFKLILHKTGFGTMAEILTTHTRVNQCGLLNDMLL